MHVTKKSRFTKFSRSYPFTKLFPQIHNKSIISVKVSLPFSQRRENLFNFHQFMKTSNLKPAPPFILGFTLYERAH